jgi:protein-L-isoaspartate(D-aspartate) O-methyltransferase
MDEDERTLRARERMVAAIDDHGVHEPRVLDALRRVRRHAFVPDVSVTEAYGDYPLPIGFGQTISQPYVVAAMTEALELEGHERVLEIGTGSGYQTAVLAELTRRVYSIEIVAPLADRAAAILSELGYANVELRTGDGHLGWSEAAPFDAILVAAAPERVPGRLLDQLAVGGRLVLPVGAGRQELLRIRRGETGYEEEELLPVRFVPMTGQPLD